VFPFLVALASAAPAHGQGGPPLVTDDPGTPGPGHWEVNVAFTLDDRGAFQTFETPLVDANYGVGERLQLKLEIPWVVGTDGQDASGLGNALIGVKWRFCDASECGAAVGIYPQVEVPMSSRSAALGLADGKASVLLPVLIQRDFGPVEVNVEAGYTFRSGQSGQWFWGVALGHSVGDFELLTEVFDSGASSLSTPGLNWDAGARWRASSHFVVLFSAGTGLSGSAGDPRARALVYLGGQFLF